MNITLKNAISLATFESNIAVEFGVNSGRTIKQMRQLIPNHIKIFGFDSFEGLPEDWIGTNHKAGDMSTNGAIPKIDGIEFYKGWFKDTIPDFINYLVGNYINSIDLIHIDCDLYSSTNNILYNLISYIRPGTILIFDEWSIHHNENVIGDEQKAFYEWVDYYNIEYELFERIQDYNEIERQIVKILKNDTYNVIS